VPEEIHAAKRINAESERIIEKANDEAGRITARAQEQAAYLIGERGLTERAEAEGRRIVAEAQDVADGVRGGADDYASQILTTLEAEVRKALAGIEKGIDGLEARRAELQPAPPPPDGDERDLGEWPEAADGSFLDQEDAGQTVAR
jgi:cell division septum initiation protein DivIVA